MNYSLEHRNEREHNCPNSALGDVSYYLQYNLLICYYFCVCVCVFVQTRVPVCPLCSQAVSVSRSRGEDVDSQVERHIMSGCKDHLVVPASQRRPVSCPHRGCKRRDLVPYTCPQCTRTVCIRHRHPMDHACQAPIISVQ